jgi:small subunit ribosomal protein S2
MPAVPLRQLLEAGVHFGHQTSRWNPQMRPYIFTARNGIHIIDLQQTQKQLEAASSFLRQLVTDGDKVLFVGTKKQAQDAIQDACERSGQYYVTHRWMGGMLTNFPVIQRRLRRLQELRAMQEKGDFERMSTKEANVHRDDLDRLEANFAGMVNMKRLPGALFVVDCKKERLAVSEANKLGIPIVAIVDTNCDPNEIQHVIPGNDDAIRSNKLIINTVAEAILEGQQLLGERELREQEELAARERQEREAAERAAAEQAAAAGSDGDGTGTAEVTVEEFAGAAAGVDTEAR